MKRVFDAPAGRSALHTWGGNGWQFTEVTVFDADGYPMREDMCGGVDPEPLGPFISRLTGLPPAEAHVIAAETTARWHDSGDEAQQTSQSRRLLWGVGSALLVGASAVAAVTCVILATGQRRRHG